MAFETTPLVDGLGFGAIVTELESAAIADPETRKALYDLWIDRGVIVFRGLPDDPDTQIALSGVFGLPDVHPLKQTTGQGPIQELADIYYRPERGDIVRLPDGRRVGAWLPWHFDLAYVERINHGGILRPVTLPADGGATGFLDGLDAWERLPADLRDEIGGLYVVYRFEGDLAGVRYGPKAGVAMERMNPSTEEIMSRIDRLPPVAHPLMFTQQETGRKVLNFSPWFALGIEGMDAAASHRILDAVAEVLIDESRAYFHRWREGDMVLWDNWRIIHSAAGIPAGQQRHMQRTTIAGDYGLGHRSAWQEAVPAVS